MSSTGFLDSTKINLPLKKSQASTATHEKTTPLPIMHYRQINFIREPANYPGRKFHCEFTKPLVPRGRFSLFLRIRNVPTHRLSLSRILWSSGGVIYIITMITSPAQLADAAGEEALSLRVYVYICSLNCLRGKANAHACNSNDEVGTYSIAVGFNFIMVKEYLSISRVSRRLKDERSKLVAEVFVYRQI